MLRWVPGQGPVTTTTTTTTTTTAPPPDDDRADDDATDPRVTTDARLALGARSSCSFVIVQVTVFPHLRIFGVVPDLGLVLAVAVAYRLGPEAGALTGFAAGLGYDLFLETPLALSALSYALTAYAIGVVADRDAARAAVDPAVPRAVSAAHRRASLHRHRRARRASRACGRRMPSTSSAVAAIVRRLVAPFVFLLVNAALACSETTVASTWSMR